MLVDEFLKMCPGGYESLPPNRRKILFFPGVGKEAEMWKKLGFQNEDFIFIEMDKELVKKLEAKYPGAIVICQALGKKYGDGYHIARRISRALEKKGFDIIDELTIINIDPENKLTAKFFKELKELLAYIRFWGEDCLVCVNFMFKRTDKRSARFHQDIAGVNPESMDREQYYREVIKNIVPKAIENIHPPGWPTDPNRLYKIVSTECGSYEGDSAKTRMYFAMHHVSRPPNLI
jgi:hypothetical protein